MAVQNKSKGQQFLLDLDTARDDMQKMFTLLRSTLEEFKPYVSLSEKISQVTDLDSVASLNSTKASINVSRGFCVSAEDFIYLTAKAYKDHGYGDIKSFKRDFRIFTQDKNTPVIAHDRGRD